MSGIRCSAACPSLFEEPTEPPESSQTAKATGAQNAGHFTVVGFVVLVLTRGICDRDLAGSLV